MQYFWFSDDIPWDTDVTTFGDAIKLSKDQSFGYLDKNDNNTIYSYDGNIVRLSKNLTKAVIVEATHRTLDYTKEEISVIDIDRATITLNSIGDSYIFLNESNTAVTANEAIEKNKIRIKTPFDGSMQISVTPASASSTHSEYILESWRFVDSLDLNNNGDGTNLFDTNKVNTKIDFQQNLYQCFAAPSIGSNNVALPELRLRADVVADTHTVKFINSNNSIIKTIDIAYDSEIYNKNTTLYYYYSYTLARLNQEKMMPRFVLMNEASSTTTFAHIDDINRSAEVYGDYKYIFNGWSSSLNGSISDNTKASVLKNENYDDVNLYASYNSAQTIEISVFNGDGEEKTYVLYLCN